MARRRLGLLLGLVGLGLALAQSAPPSEPDVAESSDEISITLERRTDDGETRLIKIENTGRDEATAALACTPSDADDPNTTPTQVVYFTPASGGVVVTVDDNVIVGPLAVVTQQPDGQGGTKSDGRVEMSAGTARVLDEAPENPKNFLERCGVLVAPEVKPDSIRVTQGKTRLLGSKLVYDETDGVARVSGPITFSREDLSGKSDTIEVDVEDNVTTLVGNVELRDKDRVSTAGRVDYDDEQSVAILRGTEAAPAQSVTPKDTIRAQTIRYNLDTGEVVVQGGITGKFEDGDETTPAPPAPPSTPTAP